MYFEKLFDAKIIMYLLTIKPINTTKKVYHEFINPTLLL
jgi:hypothetical protein